MQLAVDTLATSEIPLTRNNAGVTRASCQQRNGTAGIRVPQWACVHTYPQAERYAQANLQAKGYATWLPLVRIQRRDRVVRTLRHRIEVPAFSRYVFVAHRSHEPWTPVRYTEGVQDLVRMGEQPAHVSDMALQALRNALEADAGREPTNTGFSPGTPLRLSYGPLRGCDAIALKSGPNTTLVSVLLLGNLQQVTVPTRHLVPRD